MIEMKCCDILGTRILVTNMADTVERIGKDIVFYRCDTAACDEVVFRMKQVRNACVNEQ